MLCFKYLSLISILYIFLSFSNILIVDVESRQYSKPLIHSLLLVDYLTLFSYPLKKEGI